MTAEILAMLGPKTSSWIGGQGSYGAMRWEDWVRDCSNAGLSKAATRFGWLKYAEHLTMERILACSLVYEEKPDAFVGEFSDDPAEAQEQRTKIEINRTIKRHILARNRQGVHWRIQRLALDAIRIGKALEQRQKWGKPLEAPEMIRFCELALAEALVDRKCRTCRGSGEIEVRSLLRTCPTCNGVGDRTMSGAERATLVGLRDDNWRKHWRSRYESVLDAIRQWDRDLNRALRQVRYEPG